MLIWPQQIRDEIDGIFHISDRYAVVCRAILLLQVEIVVGRVPEIQLDSFVENQCAGVKNARA